MNSHCMYLLFYNIAAKVMLLDPSELVKEEIDSCIWRNVVCSFVPISVSGARYSSPGWGVILVK